MALFEEKAVHAFRTWLQKMSASQAHNTQLFGRDAEAGEHIEVKPEEAVDLFLRLPEGKEFSNMRKVLLLEAQRRAGRPGILDLSKKSWSAEQARASQEH